jgi:hypothetical protein
MTQDEAFMNALAEFEKAPAVAKAVSTTDVCGTYAKVKPILQGILPFIQFIPRIGKPSATAIQALMAGLDSICLTTTTPAVTPPAAFAGSSSDQAFMAALAEFENPAAAAPFATTANVCDTYKKVRPILEGLLPFIGLIPKIGKPTSVAIAALMAALDSFCPAT